MSKRCLCLILGFLVLGGNILGREYWIKAQKPLFHLGVDSMFFTSNESPFLEFGDVEWFHELYQGRYESWIKKRDIKDWNDFNVGEVSLWGDTKFFKVTKNIGILEVGEHRFLIQFGDPDIQELIKTSLQYEFSYWIIFDGDPVKMFPKPFQGIIYLDDQKPNKNWSNYVIEKRIPIVLVKDFQQIVLSFNNYQWKLVGDPKK